MNRYLLFDSACNLCAKLAEDIIQESGGWLEARSLRESAIRVLLDKSLPDWRWEPMILEVDEDGVRVFSGIKIGLYLTAKLGIRHAWRIVQLVRKAGVPVFNISLKRRLVLKGVGGTLGGLTILGLRSNYSKAQENENPGSNKVFLPLVQNTMQTLEASAVKGELYGGFVLLPENAPLPTFVKDYQHGIPTMCGVHDSASGPEHRAEADAVEIKLANVNALVVETKKPAYALAPLASITETPTVSVVKHGTGQMWGSWVTYSSEHPHFKQRYTSISILAQYDFPQPYPLWASTPKEEGGPSVELRKIEILPGKPGILIQTPVGFDLHWIEQEVYYMLSLDHPVLNFQAVSKVLTRITS